MFLWILPIYGVAPRLNNLLVVPQPPFVKNIPMVLILNMEIYAVLLDYKAVAGRHFVFSLLSSGEFEHGNITLMKTL